MIDVLNLQPAPGHATIEPGDYGRVLFTPPEAAAVPVIMPTGARWNVQPVGDGRAILRDASGEAWGIFANEDLCRETAERLSQ